MSRYNRTSGGRVPARSARVLETNSCLGGDPKETGRLRNMTSPTGVKNQLESLRIPREQRPSSGGGSGGRWGRRLFLLLILAAIAGGAYYGRDRIGPLIARTAPAAEIRIVKVAARTQPGSSPIHTATGKIVSDHRVQVSTKVSGQIVALNFEQGDRVQKGQQLAQIEDVLYRARRDEATARLARSQATLEFQQFNFNRTSALVNKNVAASVEYAEALRGIRETEAQLAADKASLQWSQKALDDCIVVAPIAGVVLERNVEIGDFVSAEGGRGAIANAQFAVIADMSKLRVEVDVSELDIARIHKDMRCTITPDAYKDRKYSGFVMWIDPGANYAKTAVQVKVRIEDPDDFLRVEGSAQVVFLPDRPASAPATQESPGLWIPATACLLDKAGTTGKVFVVSDGRLKQATISVGRQTAGQLEVLAGLREGQSIVAEGLDRLSDGQRIAS
jgi:HlyD family secretion protein